MKNLNFFKYNYVYMISMDYVTIEKVCWFFELVLVLLTLMIVVCMRGRIY